MHWQPLRRGRAHSGVSGLCQKADLNYVVFNGLAATASIADCRRDRGGFYLE